MSDPGFPPFRSAQPKGQRVPREDAPHTASEVPIPAKVHTVDFVEPVAAENLHEVEHITICAKCGSREVREAVLIGDEVYVKVPHAD
jgi:hypothetical protein